MPITATLGRHRGKKVLTAALIGIGVAVGVFLLALASVVPFSSETARSKLVDALASRFESEVDLDRLRLRVLPRLRASGETLTVRHKGRRDVPPLISISSLAAEGGIAPLLGKHVSLVTLEGLDIQIPPRNREEADASTKPTGSPIKPPFVIDELVASNARLVLIPRQSDKTPKVWTIHDLRMTSVAFDRAMPFDATVTNAIPPGDIVTSGTFGPWRGDEPSLTPLDGAFTFEQADLSVFKGISGILSARGTFGGRLDEIEVRGDSLTPEFALASIGHPIPLRASYHTVVDGTNGNTFLKRIDASFLNTSLVASGDVVDDTPGVPGRRVTLDITMDSARLEDILWLAVKSPNAAMTGALTLKTRMEIPPEDEDVVQKLKLDGTFSITGTRFTNLDIQQKVDELSRRSRGRPAAPRAAGVTSDFRGRFRLADGVLTIPAVAFDVPGAIVRLSGTYGLTSEAIDFRGTLLMDAKLSETVTGFKSLLLKLVDPLFRGENGGSAIPIRITGRRSNPSFGLDKGRIFS
ncbi:MAG TPA: AsmA-like C-terminal region-containing protein [Vicinamibacterales bacterium]|jgi:hypothetical protein|nr:AsmA-like C-terminal region-containing protein [Vicinamibacterales bacterium]